jgi:hypothetical protein
MIDVLDRSEAKWNFPLAARAASSRERLLKAGGKPHSIFNPEEGK